MLADTSLVLGMPFLIFSSALAEGELIWRTYTAADTLLVEGSIRPKLMYPPAPLTLMLRTSLSTDSSTSATQWLSMMGLMIVVVIVAILTGSFIQGFSMIAAPLTSMIRTSISIDSLTNAAQIVVKYDEADDIRWCWWQVGRKIGKKVQKTSKT